MKTLIIVAHLDDEVLGSAGLIQKLVSQPGHSVNIWVAFGRKYPGEAPERAAALLEDQKLDAIQSMRALIGRSGLRDWNPFGGPMLEEGEPASNGYYGLLLPLENHLQHFRPEQVVIPGAFDLNQDHRFLNEVCRIALRPGNLGRVRRVIESVGLDVLQPVDANYGVEMGEPEIQRMLDAMGKYERESRTGAHPRSPENLVAQRRFYGARFGMQYAEPYRLVMERN